MGRGKRKRTFFEESLSKNMQAYDRYVNQLMELTIACWKWHNLPDSVDQRYMEYTLMMNGSVIYFRDEVIGDLALSVTFNGNFDVYGNPILRRAYSKYNNYQRLLKYNNSVIIWNNALHTNSFYYIRQFASRLYQYDRIIDINLNAQKTPVTVSCSERQRLSMLNFIKEYDGNVPFIMLEDGFNTGTVKAFNTTAPFVADKVYTLRMNVWNEALAFMGIKNINTTKKERLITDEIMLQNRDAEYYRSTKLQQREWAADQINKMFGTNISVEFVGDELITQNQTPVDIVKGEVADE